MISEGSCDVED